MIQAIDTHTPSRRTLLGGTAALLAGAAVAATSGANTAAASHDAELIRLCAEHIENFDAYNNDPSHLEPEENPVWHAYERTRDAIAAAKPKTIAGMLTKARAAKVEASHPDGRERPEGQAAIWAWDLVNDLIRLNGSADELVQVAA
jgi:hypothetical protein